MRGWCGDSCHTGISDGACRMARPADGQVIRRDGAGQPDLTDSFACAPRERRLCESRMRENCTSGLSGGRRPARQRAPPPTRQRRNTVKRYGAKGDRKVEALCILRTKPHPCQCAVRLSKRENIRPQEWDWIERSIWTERMLEALKQGVKGGVWFSLIDKVIRVNNLRTAWSRVKAR